MRDRLTIGCLVLVNVVLLVPFVVAAYLWLSFEWAERENDRRRRAASEALVTEARDTAARTAGALTASRDTGTDAVLGVIWKHTGSPVITHDEERRVFTAVVARSAEYHTERTLLGDPGVVEGCLAHTYVRRPGAAWTWEVTERDRPVCEGSDRITDGVRSAQRRLGVLDAKRLTRTGLQDALDPDRLPGVRSHSEVRGLVRKGRTVVALVLFRERYGSPYEEKTGARQCYRLTRVLDPDDPYHLHDPDGGTGDRVTAVPVDAC